MEATKDPYVPTYPEDEGLEAPKPPSLQEIETVLKSIREQQVNWRIERQMNGTSMGKAITGVFISGEDAVKVDNLRDNRVTHVVSCCAGTMYPQERFDGVDRMIIGAEDTPQYPMLRHLPKVIEFLSKKRRDCAGLLHCRKGINRSAALGIALRIRQVVKGHVATKDGSENLPSVSTLLAQAWRAVSEHRGQLVIMNPGFQRQLYMYAHLLLAHGYRSKWPPQWGPEIWMPISPVSCPGKSVEVPLRQLRLQIEKRSFPGGLDEALGHAARATVNQLEYQGIQVLTGSNAVPAAFGTPGTAEAPCGPLLASRWAALQQHQHQHQHQSQ